MTPGTRFFLADTEGDVVYRGTALASGGADMDVVKYCGVVMVHLTARALADIYNPVVHTFGTIGSAV